MVKTPHKTCKRSSKPQKSTNDEEDTSPKLPTIMSAADLQGSDLGFPTSGLYIGRNQGSRERKCGDQSEDSTAYASSGVSDDESICSDGDSFWTSPLEERNAREKRNVSTTDKELPAVTLVQGAPVSGIKTNPRKYHIAAYTCTAMCMMSPFSCGMVVARLMERMPLLPILWNFCLLTKHRSNSKPMPLASCIMCFLAMISPLPTGLAVARIVQHQPLVAMVCALCITKGKRNAVEFVRKITRFCAYSMVVPSLFAPMSCVGLCVRLCKVLNLHPKTFFANAIASGAILYLMPASEEHVDDES